MLNADGPLDTSFGTNGFVRTNWHFNSTLPRGYPYSLAIQHFADGSEFVIVAGSWGFDGRWRTYLGVGRIFR